MKKGNDVLNGLACAAVLALTLTGCAHYYQVTDPGSGKVFYTDHIQNKGRGVIRFTDGTTRSEVTLTSSEVMKITKDQFRANTGR